MTNQPITPGMNSFCSDEMANRSCIMPMAPRASQYGIAPEFVKKRLAEYPEMKSLTVKELFPDSPDVIYPGGEGIAGVRSAAEKALEKIDMVTTTGRGSGP